MSNEESFGSGTERTKQRRPFDAWVLGALSLCGLVGVIVTLGLIVARTAPNPQALSPRATTPAQSQPAGVQPQQVIGQPGPRGEQGAPGPAGPRGPAGDAGIRIARVNCATGNCTVECNNDETILIAHCGVGRAQAVYPTENSALCRSPRSTAKVEIVAACAKISRR